MSYIGIFFRNSEIEKLQLEYSNSSEIIHKEAVSYFSNTTSLDNLYLKVSLLENSKSILESFRYKSANYNIVKGTTLDSYVDPFTQSPDTVYGINFAGSEFIFYLTIVIFITLIFTLFTKLQKLKKFFAVIFIGLLIFNFVNYYVIEPKKIAEVQSGMDLKYYKDYIYSKLACETFDNLYITEPNQSHRVASGNTTYSYDVIGEDEEGNSVEGNVDVDSDSGSGNLSINGNDVYITVEWEGHGELIGHDEDGNSYNLKVK